MIRSTRSPCRDRIRNACLADRPLSEPLDIGLAEGRIVAIESGLKGAAETYDAAGRLACAGLIETHIHLDKSRIIDRCPPEAGREINPMKQLAALKPGCTSSGCVGLASNLHFGRRS